MIVGAGTAGCILAARLSEGGRHSVAVIEAGRRSRNPLLSIPAGVGRVWQDPAYNWNYVSEPEPALEGRVLKLPRGRVVGGSSSINAMNFVRGNRADYDAWAQAGLGGWSFDDVLPY
ncbi:GMC family oxidoreductase N-terminal domain-containing protein, partial [Rhizobiaceae sp. 2RAB30]